MNKIFITLFINNKRTTIKVDYDEENQKLNLSDKSITSLKGAVFPENVSFLNISYNYLEDLEGVVFPKFITILNVNGNKLSTFKGIPETVISLDASQNYFKNFEGLPPNLLILDIWSNRKTINTLSGLPRGLTHLNISGNKIKNFDGIPPNITYLNISANKITSLEVPGGLPSRLVNLNVSRNNLKTLKGLSEGIIFLDASRTGICSLEGLPQSIIDLDVSMNEIFSLEGLPRNVEKLHIWNNILKTLDDLPPRINDLDISDNEITHLPIELIHLMHLTKFVYYNNPIENIHPSVARFLESFVTVNTRSNNTIYNDKQNVHNKEVQHTVRESLNAITKYKQVITESLLPLEDTSFLNDREVHSYFHFTEKEVLIFVENAIEVSNYSTAVKEELYTLLKEALKEGRKVCSTGRIGRLVNVLSGFDDNVQIKISDNAQIGAVVSMFRNRKEPRNAIEEELRSRNLTEEEIGMWLEYY